MSLLFDTTRTCVITCPIEAVPKGSFMAVKGKGKAAGRTFLVPDNEKRARPFRRELQRWAVGAWRGAPTTEPLRLTMEFHFTRPKSVDAEDRPRHIVRPDVDKLCRQVLDALRGTVYADDSQVDRIDACKVYASKAATIITVVSGGE